MRDQKKNHPDLKEEIKSLKQKIRKLEASQALKDQAEQTSGECEKKYRQLLLNAPAAIIEIDCRHDRISGFNDLAPALLAYTEEELMQKDIRDLFAPKSREKYLDAVRGLKKKRDISLSGKYEFLKKDGSSLWVRMNVRRDFEDGEPTRATLVAHDLSDCRAIEEVVRQSEERYRTIIEQIVDGYFEVDLKGRFTLVNDAVCRNLGYSRKELIGLRHYVYIDEQRAGEIMNLYEDVYKTGMPVSTYDLEVTRKDGAKTIHEISVSLMKDAQGRPAGFRGITRDVTDRKREEEERNRYERVHGILEMAGTVCHELNQPMQIISGYAEMILKSTAEDDPHHEKLRKIIRQIQRMGDITKKLMRINSFETKDYAGFSRIINIHQKTQKETP